MPEGEGMLADHASTLAAPSHTMRRRQTAVSDAPDHAAQREADSE